MKSIFFKSMSISVAILFVLTAFTGCGAKNTEQSPTTAQSQASGATSGTVANSEPDVLKMVVPEAWTGITYDNLINNYIQEKTNTKWELTVVPGADLEDKLNVLLSSGERPDIIQYNSDDTETKYVEANLLLPVNKYFDKTPNLQKNWSGVWDVMKRGDGNIYAIPVQSNPADFSLMYRKDWLAGLNLEIPKTIDEYYNVAVAIAGQDPDGDGKKNTYAFGCDGSDPVIDWRFFDHIFGAFGVLPESSMLADGKIVEGSVQPGAKEALRFLNKLYKAAALDPEFVTDNYDRADEKFQKGLYGATSNYTFMVDPLTVYNTTFKTVYPNGEWVAVTEPLQAPGFNAVGMRLNPKRGWSKTSVLKDSEKVDAALRLLDWFASEEGTMTENYGLEGQQYNMKDGVVVPTVTQDDYKKLGIKQMGLAKKGLYLQYSLVFQNTIKEVAAKGMFSPVENIMVPESSKYGQTLSDYTQKTFIKMIVGDVPIDGGFETYVKEWEKLGGQQLFDAYNRAYAAKK